MVWVDLKEHLEKLSQLLNKLVADLVVVTLCWECCHNAKGQTHGLAAKFKPRRKFKYEIIEDKHFNLLRAESLAGW